MNPPVTIAVSPLSEVSAGMAEFEPAAVMSLVSPGLRLARLDDRPHLILRFHDIEAPRRGYVHPDMKTMSAVVAFAAAAAANGGCLMIHCKAGLSRAPAAGLVASMALCGSPVARVVEWADLAPWVQPNRLMMALGCAVLGYPAAQVLGAVAERFRRRHRAWFGALGAPGRTFIWGSPTLHTAGPSQGQNVYGRHSVS